MRPTELALLAHAVFTVLSHETAKIKDLSPVVAGLLLVRKYLVEVFCFLDEDVALLDWLVQQHCLQPHQLEHCQKHADQSPLRVRIVQ